MHDDLGWIFIFIEWIKHVKSKSSFKEVLHPQINISMFCVLSQNYQHFSEK